MKDSLARRIGSRTTDPDSLRPAGLSGVIIRLRRNVGHQRAIAVGLGFVADELQDADRIVVMDSDGEDLPATIHALLNAPATAIVLKLVGFATPGWFSYAFGVLLLVFLQESALRLMTLILSGVARGSVVLADAYREIVDTVIPVSAFDRE